MNWAQTVNTLIFVFGTFGSVLEAIYLSRLWIQKMPEHTRLALEQFARMAVQQVEQESTQLSNPAKKQLAITTITKLFQEFGLPVPSSEAINIALEAAVLLLPETNSAELPKPTV